MYHSIWRVFTGVELKTTDFHAGQTGFNTAVGTGEIYQSYLVLAIVTIDNIFKKQSRGQKSDYHTLKSNIQAKQSTKTVSRILPTMFNLYEKQQSLSSYTVVQKGPAVQKGPSWTLLHPCKRGRAKGSTTRFDRLRRRGHSC